MEETARIIASFEEEANDEGLLELDGRVTSSWRPPTPPRVSRPSTLKQLSNMAKRALQNIGGVDSSVPLSPADELLLSEKEHSQHGQLQRRTTIESVSSEDYNNNKTRTGYRNLVGTTVAQRSPTKIRFSSKQSVIDKEDEVVQHQDYAHHQEEARITTSYTSLPPEEDPIFSSSSSSADKVLEECNVFYDLEQGDPLRNSTNTTKPSQIISLKHSLNNVPNPRFFQDPLMTAAWSTKNSTHRRTLSARYNRDVAALLRANDYYCGLGNVVSWSDWSDQAGNNSIESFATPLPSGVVDVDVSTNSTLYELNTHTGRVQIHLPKDDVRLVMDPNLEAGILCVVVTEDESKFQLYHSSSSSTNKRHTTKDETKEEEDKKVPPLTYILTVDDDLYKRVLNELAERWSQPCGLYFCSHETDETSRVSAWFAALILGVILLIMFVITIITQG